MELVLSVVVHMSKREPHFVGWLLDLLLGVLYLVFVVDPEVFVLVEASSTCLLSFTSEDLLGCLHIFEVLKSFNHQVISTSSKYNYIPLSGN